MGGNKYKEGKTRGRLLSREEGKKWWLRGDTREPPKKPPGIFHRELKELASNMEVKELKNSRTMEESRHANNLQASLHADNMYPYGVL